MNNSAREDILGAIRSHLAASVPYDKQEISHGSSRMNTDTNPISSASICGQFKMSLEAVDGHGRIVHGDKEIAQALTEIISVLSQTKIAISDNPEVERLLNLTDLEIEELSIAPNAHDIFRFDVGISTAQAAIAETGTLVLDSTGERHRLVSLVPPVHIAIIRASQIYRTLGEVLTLIHGAKEVSPAVTFITGPSRTADIELTLAIGVHGPQELYVIIDEVN
ncbi:MAG TPA: lactate utilization protein [Pyrinomonadaceae bacterium]|jgi:L-lactate dehydrogenase complex protein LldG|nr:lactate utilization protein [Pyrinomonadaceae bacterium]